MSPFSRFSKLSSIRALGLTSGLPFLSDNCKEVEGNPHFPLGSSFFEKGLTSSCFWLAGTSGCTTLLEELPHPILYMEEKVPTSNSKEEFVSETELPSLLLAQHSKALELIKQNNPSTALRCLKRCEEIMEAVFTQGGKVDSCLLLSTLNNLAYCYQQ